MSSERLTPADSRRVLRAILEGDSCVRPASVYDALSVRAAARLGFPLAMLGGSVAALAVLGAPDHQMLTLDEVAGLCRRICRAGALPLLVDADHGFGNALHATRTVEELEAVGVAGMTLEDTALPIGFGATAPALVSLEEARARLVSALEARGDPSFVIVARTDARLLAAQDLIDRVRAYGAEGADALFVTGARAPEVLAEAAQVSRLPLIVPEPKGALAGADLAALGVRICLTPHRTLPAALSAAWDSLAAAPGAREVEKPADLVETLSEAQLWDDRISRFLTP
ncbi:isocitrate lyase/PEP mutase family protein [Maliponia aquimaris]|uniref:Oxaloacetate decarboxylase n=1 Tax=Maliponia aquimaris TaxID=1673631 RepID=A0A238K317_9RHOB|nr:isocitrate lyase/PEP mutase family protein [Maliponia aquimaris]SMX36857.1 Oxaloacetate decarboxylase [Maliponia aquimaris]